MSPSPHHTGLCCTHLRLLCCINRCLWLSVSNLLLSVLGEGKLTLTAETAGELFICSIISFITSWRQKGFITWTRTAGARYNSINTRLYQNHTRIWSDSDVRCHRQTGRWRKVCILSDRRTVRLPKHTTRINHVDKTKRVAGNLGCFISGLYRGYINRTWHK